MESKEITQSKIDQLYAEALEKIKEAYHLQLENKKHFDDREAFYEALYEVCDFVDEIGKKLEINWNTSSLSC